MADRYEAGSSEGRNPDGTFAKGNPGKQPGTKLRSTRAVEDLMNGERDKLSRKAIDLALEGDTTALRLCLERIAPPRKDGPVRFDLPSIGNAQEAANAAAAVLQAVSEGDLTPLEGATVMGLVDNYRRVLETTEIEERLTKLEAKR
ncbi:MAG: hypothetical protein AAFQ79_02375 [Pseudomonadota bacterium]